MTGKWPKGFDQNVIQFKREEMAKSVSIPNTQTHKHSSFEHHLRSVSEECFSDSA